MPDNTTIVNLQQLKDHINGVGSLNHHTADKIDLNPSLTILGEEFLNVQSVIEKLKSVAFPFIPEATEDVKGILKLAGDLRGNSTDLPDTSNQQDDIIPRVRGLQGYAVANLKPNDGYVLTWDEALGWWEPKPALSASNFNYATPYKYGIVRLSDGFYPGDIGGTAGNLIIKGLQSYPLNLGDENPVYPDHFLKWNGAAWINSYLPVATFEDYGIIKLGGDIGGNAGSLELVGIQGTPLDVSCANNGDAIVYNAEDGIWTCGAPNLGFTLSEDVAPGTSGGVKVVGLDKRPILHQNIDQLNNLDVLTYYNGYWQGMPLPYATSISRGIMQLDNDLGGSADSPYVVGFYNNPLDQTTMLAPVNKQIMQYASSEGPGNGKWKAVFPDSIINFSGDLDGNTQVQKCIGWAGQELNLSQFEFPNEGDMPVYDGTRWTLIGGNVQANNPEIRTFYSFSGVRNTYKRYQLSAISQGEGTGLFINYPIPDNTSIIITGKIIGRIVNDDFVDPNIEPVYMPNPTEGEVVEGNSQLLSTNKKLKFDLDNLPASTLYYNIEAGYEKTVGSGSGALAPLRYVDDGSFHNSVVLISTYPYPFDTTFFISPSVSLVSPSNIVISTGASLGTVINWTLYLEIYENGV